MFVDEVLEQALNKTRIIEKHDMDLVTLFDIEKRVGFNMSFIQGIIHCSIYSFVYTILVFYTLPNFYLIRLEPGWLIGDRLLRKTSHPLS